ncbi:hypothetical protein V0288_23745 [Pannus brasiliensis CCIBt3594]|uniref:Uncharacterized protein n=1 Tax=Pannus brasiliensis CCIBt3594 TaxID=1427578 RepID=A0AAW9QXZ0_9CHRO
MKTFTGTYSKIDEAIGNLTNAQCTAQEEGGLPFDLATKLEKAIELCEEIIGELDRESHDDLTRAVAKGAAEPNERYK